MEGQYLEMIDSLLKGETPTVRNHDDMPHPNSEGFFRVIVTDTDGDPVEDVAVRFCSDTACRFGETDEKGIAEFRAEEGTVYSVHIDDVPEGYEENDREYKTGREFCDVCVTLQKQ